MRPSLRKKKTNTFSLVVKRVNILGVKPLEWHQARIWPCVAARRQKESEFSLSTGAYSWPQPVKADDLMIHSGKQGRMTSGLSFPHHFYQLPLESQHIRGQDDCTPQSQVVLPAQPLEQEHEGWSLRDTWEFNSKTEAVHQPQEDKLNISFLCGGFQQRQPLPCESVYSEQLCTNRINKLFTAWITSQWEDPKSTDGKEDNSSCGGSKIVCGTERSNNDSEC